jgi:hypothetical protein
MPPYRPATESPELLLLLLYFESCYNSTSFLLHGSKRGKGCTGSVNIRLRLEDRTAARTRGSGGLIPGGRSARSILKRLIFFSCFKQAMPWPPTESGPKRRPPTESGPKRGPPSPGFRQGRVLLAIPALDRQRRRGRPNHGDWLPHRSTVQRNPRVTVSCYCQSYSIQNKCFDLYLLVSTSNPTVRSNSL